MSSPLDDLNKRPTVFIQAKIPADLNDQVLAYCEENKATKSQLVVIGLKLLMKELEFRKQKKEQK